MTLTQLEVFAVVVEQTGFTSAGRRLGISQSAVSHALTGLEQELGIALIERGRQRFVVTAIGQRLHGHALEILRRRDRMQQEAASAIGLRQGKLTLGSFGQSASIRLLPPLIANFRQRNPAIEVAVLEGAGPEIIDWIHNGQVDVGFVTLPNDGLNAEFVTADQLVALVPVDHELAARQSVTLAELGREPFIMSAAGSGPLIERAFADAAVVPNVRYRIQQVNSIVNFVQHGLGVSIIAELALPEQIAGFEVLQLEPNVTRRIGLAMRKSDPSPLARAFIKSAAHRR